MAKQYAGRKEQPIVSVLLVAVNVIVYIICSFTGSLLYDAGMLDLWHVLVQKEYGRIVWSLFLHQGMSHIFNNMLILFFLGAMLERETGHISFAVIYLISGIGGNLLSLVHKAAAADVAPSLGASGAVFGLDGVLLAMVLFSGRKMENVTPLRVVLMIVYSLYGGFTGYHIDNAAHIGGLLTGFLAGVLLCLLQRKKTVLRERKSFEY